MSLVLIRRVKRIVSVHHPNQEMYGHVVFPNKLQARLRLVGEC